MQRFCRLGAVVVVVAALLMLSTPDLGAVDPGLLGEGNASSGEGVVTIDARSEWLPLGSEGGRDPACEVSSVELVVADDFVTPVLTSLYMVDQVVDGGGEGPGFRFSFPAAAGRRQGVRLFSPSGAWYRVFCDGGLSLVPGGGPAVSVEGLVLEAVGRIDPGDPVLAVTPDHGRHVVRMPSWLAVDGVSWRSWAASAVAGRVVVTASLTPFETVWDLGNGEVVVCDNPGRVWRRGLSEGVNECPYTYTWPSINPPDNTFELSGTVRYEVGYTTNAPGSYGPFVPVDRTSFETVEVVEIQVVNTYSNVVAGEG